MNEQLSTDEYDALTQISEGIKHERPSACVARNSKRLNGLKFITRAKDGRFSLTEKGETTLFLRQCILNLRALSTDPLAPIKNDVAYFLEKKGHIIRRTPDGGFDVTQRGRESLADIDATSA